MESILNYMTVGDALYLIEIRPLNGEDYHYYVEDGVIKYGE